MIPPSTDLPGQRDSRAARSSRGVPVLATLIAALLISITRTSGGAEPEPDGTRGYYRFPALHGDQVVFTAEGDLWKVPAQGGVAQRLTSHPGMEKGAMFSPDGRTLAFVAEYEGATEVYTMPANGGLPVRRTFEGGPEEAVGWAPDGRLLYSSRRIWSLPDPQLTLLNLASGETERLPLSQASRGAFDDSGQTLFFTRLPFHRGSVKRYQGGTAETLWKFTRGDTEAKPLTADYAGTSRSPLWWKGRVYFVSDRDGTMNLWSMNPDGADLKQHTRHASWEVKGPALSNGRIVYQLGPDLHLLDLAADKDSVIPVTLASDLDQQREKWIKKPLEYVSAAHLSPQGDRVVLTARGQVFVAPVGPGRLTEVTRDPKVRHRHAAFLPDGKSLLSLSDQSGEVEFTRLPANGVGRPEQLTSNGTVFRFEGELSPNGKWLAWHDKDQKLWVHHVEKRETRLVADSPHFFFSGLAWSPDSRWLAYVAAAENQFHQIWIFDTQEGRTLAVTSDRVISFSPAWSPDGKWLYFISDRTLRSVVGSPWGHRQPEPYFDKTGKLYLLGLAKDQQRSPFDPPTELNPAKGEKPDKADKPEKPEPSEPAKKPEPSPDRSKKPAELAEEKAASKSPTNEAPAGAGDKSRRDPALSTNKTVAVTIDFAGLSSRLWEVPVPAGNYSNLSVNEKRLFWLAHEPGDDGKQNLMVLDITNEEPKPKTFAEAVRGYELSLDRKKVLVRKGENFHVEEASTAAPSKLEKSIDLKGWTFSLIPRDEWRQMFVEAWRLERDYFYDRRMHGVDWPAMLKKYLPTVDRVTDRAELSDLIGDMVSELAALHIRVTGGDEREGPDRVGAAGLGARLVRDEPRGGWRVDHIYLADPEYPDRLPPLAQPGVGVKEGDVIELINGVSTLSVPNPRLLLRNQAGKQVLLGVKSTGEEKSREVVVVAQNSGRETEQQYTEWEIQRRQRVEQLGEGELGYVHLRAMGADDIAQWAREYYPIYTRKGLIIDVRHNSGGNIDSWVLARLLRKAWFYWQPRAGSPTWNMHYAFRGHMVVLCDEFTASDGEAFTEGFRRLGLGKVIGKRTWGGEIWLSASNFLVDHGIATAAEIGVYGPESEWLIEGHGVDPDIVVDNLPHATFLGEDAQLLKAIEHLQEQIRLKPVTLPPTPAYPNKAAK